MGRRPLKKEGNTYISAVIPSELHKKLVNISFYKNITIKEMVIEALELYVAKHL